LTVLQGSRWDQQEPARRSGAITAFTSITFFTSLDAAHGFAGDGYELAVVEEAAEQALDR